MKNSILATAAALLLAFSSMASAYPEIKGVYMLDSAAKTACELHFGAGQCTSGNSYCRSGCSLSGYGSNAYCDSVNKTSNYCYMRLAFRQ